MEYIRELIDKLTSDEINGCIQIKETFDVDSLEAASTAILLDGIYQNRAVYANAEKGMVSRAKLKDGIQDSSRLIKSSDVIFEEGTDEIRLEQVYGDVQILCCSGSVLKLIQTIVGNNVSDS